VVCLPSEYEPDHPFAYEKDQRTEPGEPLSPQRMPTPILRAKRAESERLYLAKHQQRPEAKEGGMFSRALWGRYQGHPRQMVQQALEVVQTWDCADKPGKDNAFSVCHTVGRFKLPIGPRYRVLGERRGKMELPELIDVAASEIRSWQPWLSTVYIEDAHNGTALIQYLRRMDLGGVSIIAVNPRGDKQYPGGSKEDRAQYTLTACEGGLWELPEDQHARDAQGNSWAEGIITEHEGFPLATIKDRVDTLSQVSIRWQAGPTSTITDVNKRLGAMLGAL